MQPGKAAIQAALHPSDTGYYYFFHDTKGNLYTAKTYAEFKQKIQTYAPIWPHDEAGGIVVLAGDMERLELAVKFGADAVYVGGTQFGMRSNPSNFDLAQLQAACKLVHAAESCI